MKTLITEALNRYADAKAKPAGFEKSPDDEELEKLAATMHVNIRIMGCGGGGSNTINRCVEEGISGAEMCAVNTDAKHLLAIHAPKKIFIGRRTTRGLGAGALPNIGEQAAKEDEELLRNYFRNSDVAFITAGMGGGTGTAAAPIAAKVAKDYGALVMGVVTLPFKSEGSVRMQNAEYGLEKLVRECDTTIVIPNDKLLELVPHLSLDAAFKVADEVLMQCIKGITEIVTKPGLVNLDYSDIKTVMKDGGVAMIGIGESDAPADRVKDAVAQALNCPLLGEIDVTSAKGALIRVSGGPDMTVTEAENAARFVSQKLPPSARIIWGCSVDESLQHTIRVLLILTGVKSKYIRGKEEGAYTTTEDAGIEMVR